MLPELLRSLTLRAPPWARKLGLVHEHVAITFRRRRAGRAWAPHLEASRAAILAAAGHCSHHTRVLVIAAGDCADVPVAELAARFDEVVLSDVVLGPELGRHVRAGHGRVRTEIWDATGVLERLAGTWGHLGTPEIEALFANTDPGPPPGGEPDLVISANCISQLGVVPLDRFTAPDADEAFIARCAAAAARRHQHWLAQRPGVRVLLGDVARRDVAPGGRELRRECVPGMEELRVPDRSWDWMIAPIPEFSREFHRVHEVGMWIEVGTEPVARCG
jgi:hypothetical protein